MPNRQQNQASYIPQRLHRQRPILLHQPANSTSQLNHAIKPMEMYQSSRRLVMYLLVDGETNHSSNGTVGNGKRTRQFNVDQSIRLGNVMESSG